MRWFGEKNRTRTADRPYAVVVHSHNLLIRSSSGMAKPGGAYSCQHVTAGNEAEAMEKALRYVAEDDLLLRQILNAPGSPPRHEIDEVTALDPRDHTHGTAYVFYIDTDEQDA